MTLTKDFFLAGKAIFTIANGKGVDYTYRITKKAAEGTRPAVYFVGLLTGPNNDADYTYLGLLNSLTGDVRVTANSRYLHDSKPVVAVKWALGRVWEGKDLPAPATLQHVGRCGKCARPLTVPESIETGLGPECSGLGYTKPRTKPGRRRKAVPAPTPEQSYADTIAAAAAARLAERRIKDGVAAAARLATQPSAYEGRILAEAGQPARAADEVLPAEPAPATLTFDSLSSIGQALLDEAAAKAAALPAFYRGVSDDGLDYRFWNPRREEDSVDRAERALGVQ